MATSMREIVQQQKNVMDILIDQKKLAERQIELLGIDYSISSDPGDCWVLKILHYTETLAREGKVHKLCANSKICDTLPPAQLDADVDPEGTPPGWTPTMSKIARNNSIKPDMDRWKATLDPLLIFVTLFSAVVTGFLVPQLGELSQNPTERTNELIANLTEVIIQLSTVEPSSLSLAVSSPFEPDSGAIRQTILWSLSLVISLSIASIAVAQRTYLTHLETSKATDALILMLVRWKQSIRLLKPAVYVLILAVGLFIAGLLDTIFSTAVELSPLSKRVFVAGVLCSVVVALGGVMLIYTIFFGLSSNRIPYLDMGYIMHTIVRLRSFVRPDKTWEGYMESQHPTVSSEHSMTRQSTVSPTAALKAYYVVLRRTHNQNDTAQLAVDLPGVVFSSIESWMSPLGGRRDTESITNILVHLLSPQCDSSINLTCASTIPVIYGYLHMNDSPYSLLEETSESQSHRIITELHSAFMRYLDTEQANNTPPQNLWNFAYMQALAIAHVPHVSKQNCCEASCIVILLAETTSALNLDTSLLRFQTLAVRNLFHYLDVNNFEAKLDDALRSFYALDDGIFDDSQHIISLINFWMIWENPDTQDTQINVALTKLSQWICRYGSREFVLRAFDEVNRDQTSSVALHLLDAVAHFHLKGEDTDLSFYSRIVLRVIDIVKDIFSAAKDMPLPLRNGIIAVIREMIARKTGLENWAATVHNPTGANMSGSSRTMANVAGPNVTQTGATATLPNVTGANANVPNATGSTATATVHNVAASVAGTTTTMPNGSGANVPNTSWANTNAPNVAVSNATGVTATVPNAAVPNVAGVTTTESNAAVANANVPNGAETNATGATATRANATMPDPSLARKILADVVKANTTLGKARKMLEQVTPLSQANQDARVAILAVLILPAAHTPASPSRGVLRISPPRRRPRQQTKEDHTSLEHIPPRAFGSVDSGKAK